VLSPTLILTNVGRVRETLKISLDKNI